MVCLSWTSRSGKVLGQKFGYGDLILLPRGAGERTPAVEPVRRPMRGTSVLRSRLPRRQASILAVAHGPTGFKPKLDRLRGVLFVSGKAGIALWASGRAGEKLHLTHLPLTG